MEKGKLTKCLEDARTILRKNEMFQDQLAEVRDLGERWENNQLILSVIGQFKRGKSTLINGLLGEEILPVGILPVTSVVTKIRYGNKGAVVNIDGEEREVSLQELPAYVDEKQNPKNEKKVWEITVTYPSKILENGLMLVDTPGVGSMNKHNTKAAYDYVKESDGVIFLLSVDSPVNEIEKEFLLETKQYITKMYFAVNKIDLVSPEDLEEYLAYCKEIIESLTREKDPKIFPIAAKGGGDRGIEPILNKVLEDVSKQGEAILHRSIKKKLIDNIKEALSLIELKEKALDMPLEAYEETVGEIRENLDRLDTTVKDKVYLLNRKTDELQEEIGKVLEEEAQGIIDENQKRLKALYENHGEESAKELEQRMEELLDRELKQDLQTLNEKGKSLLKEGYQSIVRSYEQELLDIYRILNRTIKETFGIDYPFKRETYTLSEKTDFYVKTGDSDTGFFVDKKDLIRLLPRSNAKKALYKGFERKIKTVVSRNVVSMSSDYRYKIQESKRIFNSGFKTRVRKISGTFSGFVIETNQQRNVLEKRQQVLRENLRARREELRALLDEILPL